MGGVPYGQERFYSGEAPSGGGIVVSPTARPGAAAPIVPNLVGPAPVSAFAAPMMTAPNVLGPEPPALISVEPAPAPPPALATPAGDLSLESYQREAAAQRAAALAPVAPQLFVPPPLPVVQAPPPPRPPAPPSPQAEAQQYLSFSPGDGGNGGDAAAPTAGLGEAAVGATGPTAGLGEGGGGGAGGGGAGGGTTLISWAMQDRPRSEQLRTARFWTKFRRAYFDEDLNGPALYNLYQQKAREVIAKIPESDREAVREEVYNNVVAPIGKTLEPKEIQSTLWRLRHQLLDLAGRYNVPMTDGLLSEAAIRMNGVHQRAAMNGSRRVTTNGATQNGRDGMTSGAVRSDIGF